MHGSGQVHGSFPFGSAQGQDDSADLGPYVMAAKLMTPGARSNPLIAENAMSGAPTAAKALLEYAVESA